MSIARYLHLSFAMMLLIGMHYFRKKYILVLP